MTFWLRYVARSLVRSRRRVALALICISVGVASVVALQTATLTVQTALTSNVRAANGGDISVSSQATPLSSSDLELFRRLQRQGRVSRWNAVYTLHATAVGTAGRLVPFEIQVVPSGYPIGGQPTFVTPANGNVGGLLRRSGDVLVTSVLADEMGMSVGGRMFVRTIGGGMHATVRGILAETSFEHSAVMTVQARDAAGLSSGPAHYTAVYVDTPFVASVASILRARFPVAQIQTVQEAFDAARQEVHDFQQFMLLVGLMALLVAGIGILNAMQSMLAWRRLEIAMLKAIGFPQRTLYSLFVGEALSIGLIGGIAGTVLGALASKLITDALARALALQVDFQLDGGTLAGGVALGLGATLVFSVLPIVRAGSFRPLEILREGQGVSPARSLPQTVGLLAIVMALFAALAAAIMGDIRLAAQFVGAAAVAFAVLTGVFAVLVGWLGRIGPPPSRPGAAVILLFLLAATGAAIIRVPSLAPLLALATAVWGATVVLHGTALFPLFIAARSLSRRRARTSVTLVAFLVGVLAMSVTLTVALSLQGQINQALASGGSTNLVALAGAAEEPTVAAASHRLRGVHGRSLVTEISTTPKAINGRPLSSFLVGRSLDRAGREDPRNIRLMSGMNGLDLARGQGATGIVLTEGRTLSRADAGTANVLVRSTLEGYPYHLTLGDRITLQESSTSRPATVTVVGFYHRPRAMRGFGSFFTAPIFGDRRITTKLGGTDTQWITSLAVAKEQLTHDATTLQAAVPGALVINVGDLTSVVQTILNELLNLLAVITALALGAGLAVVGNGVALAMLERRRELALFKAVGFGPRDVLRFVLVENALAGTLAGAVSVLMVVVSLGIISHLALTRAIGFDPLVAVLVLLGAAVLAVITAYLAARTAVQVRPLEALRNE